MKKKIPKVFFNASVVLSGIKSPTGGSAFLLRLVKHNKINGLISEVVQDEVKKNHRKINNKIEEIEKIIQTLFPNIIPAPDQKNVDKYNKIVIDTGDSHVLASSEESKTNYLVTLDAKHLLILKNNIKKFKIVSPKELIESFS